MNSKIENFYLKQEEPIKSCLLTMRSIVLAQDDHISQTIKYGMPCFCYKNKMFAYLWVDKKKNEPYILFVEGKHLNHPTLEIGNRSRMKIFRVNPTQDLPIENINYLLNEALNLYRNGVVKTK